MAMREVAFENGSMSCEARNGENIIFSPTHPSCPESIRVADGVQRIDAEDLKDCLGCMEIILPETLEAIGEGALRCCQTAEIHIPASVTHIGRQAFCVGCRLTVDEGNTAYYTDGHALLRRETDGVALQLFFDEETNAYTVPSEVTSIDDDAFDDCYALSSLTLPEGMQHFSAAALGHCQVGQLNIPASVSKVDGCHRFHAVIDARNPYFQQTEQMVFRLLEDGKRELVRVSGDAEYIEVPEGTVAIGDYAFAWSDVRRVSLPETVKKIGDYAFFASSLRLLDLPADGVRQIGSHAFAQTKLESILLFAALARIP